jgi:aminopeptidase
MLVEWCLRDRIPFYLEFDDPVFKALLINHADDNGLVRMAENFISRIDDFKKIIFVGAGLPDHTLIAPAPDRAKILGAAMAPYNKRRSSGEMFYTLTQIPTRKDSEIDQIPYDEYLTLFFEMCDQPWDKIGAAQAQLIAEFNAAKTVRITNSDGTDISMDIDGFTFANSLIAKNVPGSELFSAPRIDSTNGIIVAKGRFTRGEQLMENITLHFRDGVLAEYKVETGQDIFEHIISVDDGARRIGELGIGTNPHLKRHVANGLLVEKIGGSFHIALGAAYTYTDYMGTPVRLDNGNTSALHWDITTMLYGKQGRIALDGRVVMNDGFWVDPRYDVLNRGWAAIPEAERPAYWRNKLSA